jgi:hypothetical protein
MDSDNIGSFVWTAAALLVAAAGACHVVSFRDVPEPEYTGQSGEAWLEEILASNRERRVNHALRMKKDAFLELVKYLTTFGLAGGSKISAALQVAIFLTLLSKGSDVRDLAERFQVSKDSVTKYILILQRNTEFLRTVKPVNTHFQSRF